MPVARSVSLAGVVGSPCGPRTVPQSVKPLSAGSPVPCGPVPQVTRVKRARLRSEGGLANSTTRNGSGRVSRGGGTSRGVARTSGGAVERGAWVTTFTAAAASGAAGGSATHDPARAPPTTSARPNRIDGLTRGLEFMIGDPGAAPGTSGHGAPGITMARRRPCYPIRATR